MKKLGTIADILAIVIFTYWLVVTAMALYTYHHSVLDWAQWLGLPMLGLVVTLRCIWLEGRR
jgi:hypothetical protein